VRRHPDSRSVVLALALLSACGGEAPPPAVLAGGGGYEALLLQVPADGGVVSVHRLGSDSVLWRSREPAPPTRALLGFDEYLGTLVAQDSSGRPFGMSLRVGAVERFDTASLGALTATEGAAVFTTRAEGTLQRLTPIASWTWPRRRRPTRSFLSSTAAPSWSPRPTAWAQ